MSQNYKNKKKIVIGMEVNTNFRETCIRLEKKLLFLMRMLAMNHFNLRKNFLELLTFFGIVDNAISSLKIRFELF